MGCVFGRTPELSGGKESMSLVRFVGSTTNLPHVPHMTLIYDLKIYGGQHGIKIYLNKGVYIAGYGDISGKVLRYETLGNFRFIQIGFPNSETVEIFLDTKTSRGIYLLPKQAYIVKIRN